VPLPDLEALLSQAEAARDRGALAEGLGLAEQAWLQAGDAAAGQRRRAGLLLMHFRYRTGALAQVVALSAQVLPLLRESGTAAELVDTLRVVSLCAADTSDFAVSLQHAQEGHRLALELGDTARLSLATNVLGCFFERAGDPWQAERLMLESLALGRQQPEPHPVFVALNNLGAVLIGKFYLLRDALPLDQAREPLRVARPYVEESVALARQRGEAFFRVFTLGNLGEILVHLGEAEAAAALLDEALALAQAQGFTAQIGRLGCSRGELQLLNGQPAAAWDTLSAGMQALQAVDQPTTRMRLHHALWRAAAALDQPAPALQHLQDYLRIERQRSVRQLQAQSELFVTRMEAEQARQESQRHRARATALEADVRRDPLTGLGNRRELEARWPTLIDDMRTRGAPLSVAMIDLDHFKRVNDQHGHAVGDQVLVALAGLLQAHTRAGDLVARVGGEEFLIVLPDADAAHALEACERLRQRVAAHPWHTLAPGLELTLSLGLTSAPPYDAQTLTLRADAALHRAKAAGRNGVVQI